MVLSSRNRRMNDNFTITEPLKEKLKSIIKDLCEENAYDDACKDYLIQYTVFDNEGDDGWYMNCSIDGACYYRKEEENQEGY